jgi:hypothetical protein
MRENADSEHAFKLSDRFGAVATEMGFVTSEQVKQVLAEQLSINSSNRLRPPMRIGEIFFEKGWMTQKQIQMVIERISQAAR